MRTPKEIMEDIHRLNEELRQVQTAEANAKYAWMEGKWIEFNNKYWYDDEEDEEDEDERHTVTIALLTRIRRTSPLCSEVDQVYADARFIIEFDPDNHGGVRFVNNSGDPRDDYEWGYNVDFCTNRYKEVTREYTIERVEKAQAAFIDRMVEIRQALLEIK